MKPILKWAGGKRQLMPEIIKSMPNSYKRYIEPFFGGGAVFFELNPHEAIIGDLNKELINVYETIKTDPEGLIKELKGMKNNKEYYYDVRLQDRDGRLEKMSATKRAARTVYLNKTGFNGLYRVNSKNQFNVPYGFYKNPKICDEENILRISTFLNNNNIDIINGDFQMITSRAKAEDFIYIDPPYDVEEGSNSFTSYQSEGFDREDQTRLYKECVRLNELGAYFMLSNSNTDFIRNLYKEFNIKIVFARRNINSDAKGRGKVEEVIITNY